MRDLKRAAFQAIGPTPDGCDDTFTLDGEGGGPLTADTQALDEAGVNNEATVTVTDSYSPNTLNHARCCFLLFLPVLNCSFPLSLSAFAIVSYMH